MKKRKREKENIPLLLWYLNTGENFVIVNVQYKNFIVILYRSPSSPVPSLLKETLSNIYQDLEIEYKDTYVKLPLRRNEKGKMWKIPLLLFYLNTGENVVVNNL